MSYCGYLLEQYFGIDYGYKDGQWYSASPTSGHGTKTLVLWAEDKDALVKDIYPLNQDITDSLAYQGEYEVGSDGRGGSGFGGGHIDHDDHPNHGGRGFYGNPYSMKSLRSALRQYSPFLSPEENAALGKKQDKIDIKSAKRPDVVIDPDAMQRKAFRDTIKKRRDAFIRKNKSGYLLEKYFGVREGWQLPAGIAIGAGATCLATPKCRTTVGDTMGKVADQFRRTKNMNFQKRSENPGSSKEQQSRYWSYDTNRDSDDLQQSCDSNQG